MVGSLMRICHTTGHEKNQTSNRIENVLSGLCLADRLLQLRTPSFQMGNFLFDLCFGWIVSIGRHLLLKLGDHSINLCIASAVKNQSFLSARQVLNQENYCVVLWTD